MPRQAGVSASIDASGGSSAGAPVPGALSVSLSSITTAGQSKPIVEVPKTTVDGSSANATTPPSVESVSGAKRIEAGAPSDPATRSAGPSAAPGSDDPLTRTGS